MLPTESSTSNISAAANVTARLWNQWIKIHFSMGKNVEKFKFVQDSWKQMLKVCMCLCRWLKGMSGSSCPMGTTPQRRLGPTPTSPRRVSSRCPNLTELRPPSDPPTLEPTSDTSANQRWNLWRCRKKNRYAHQPNAAQGWIWVRWICVAFCATFAFISKANMILVIWIKVDFVVWMKNFSVHF